jgi:hypothetical protein
MRRIVVALGLTLMVVGCAAPSSQTRLTSAAVTDEPANPAVPARGTVPEADERPRGDGEPPAKRSRNLRNAGWASIAIGGSAAVFAIGSSIIMLHDASNRSAGCNAAKECTSAGLGANAAVGNNVVTNVALWTLAVTGLGIGTFFVLTNPKVRTETGEKTGNTGIGVAPNGSGASLVLRGSF